MMHLALHNQWIVQQLQMIHRVNLIVPKTQTTHHAKLIVRPSMNPDKRTYAENQLYELFQNHYKKEPSSSIDMFCSIYYRKCKERGLFEDLVEYYRQVDGIPVLLVGRPEFTRNLTLVPPNNIEFWTLWNDTVMELDSDIQAHLFHHIKLEIERKAEETSIRNI
jgi:hypothetical protein